MEVKKCIRCKRDVPLSDFEKTKTKEKRSCKICDKEYRFNSRKSKYGIIRNMYNSQKVNSKRRKHPLPEYTFQQLKQWILSRPNFEELYNSWVESGYKRLLAPSVDRLDDYKPYTFDNIRLVTCGENISKLHKDRVIGKNNKSSRAVVQYDINNNFIKQYYSIKEASRKTGCYPNGIRDCCQGFRHSINNYKWSFANL
jgi:hypothetical protein